MHPYHARLARIGLDAAAQYGFALAGGYAFQAAGFLERPSEDVDLFTVDEYQSQFATAVRAITDAYTDDGLTVVNDLENDGYARLYVTDPRSGETSKVDLVVDFRDSQPIQMAIGPVTHPDDLMGGKMGALFHRVEPRDLIDIDAVLCSGRYNREDLLALAVKTDAGLDRRMFADAFGRATLIPDARFADYGVTGRHLDEMRARFAEWRAELLAN